MRCACGAVAAMLVIASSALASNGEAPPVADQYRPVARSTLVTRADVTFVQSERIDGHGQVTVLARVVAGAAPEPVARLMRCLRQGHLHLVVQRIPSTAGEVEVLEQLYAFLVRQEPEARYSLAPTALRRSETCDTTRQGLTHNQVLTALIAQRERAVAFDRPRPVPWRAVALSPVSPRNGDADEVAVRVTLADAPLAGASVFFNRAPHSSCAARVAPDGVAACRLVDQHGDEADHDDAEHVPVVVTFPGEVRFERVLPPITFLLLDR